MITAATPLVGPLTLVMRSFRAMNSGSFDPDMGLQYAMAALFHVRVMLIGSSRSILRQLRIRVPDPQQQSLCALGRCRRYSPQQMLEAPVWRTYLLHTDASVHHVVKLSAVSVSLSSCRGLMIWVRTSFTTSKGRSFMLASLLRAAYKLSRCCTGIQNQHVCSRSTLVSLAQPLLGLKKLKVESATQSAPIRRQLA